jgi:hypothetical protein
VDLNLHERYSLSEDSGETLAHQKPGCASKIIVRHDVAGRSGDGECL